MARIVVTFMFSVMVMLSSATLSAGGFEGVWKMKDTVGKEFEITLSGNGTASATLRPDMIGTWKEEGATAVIKWQSGWITKIEKSGKGYFHFAYRPGNPLNGPPTASSDAQKIR
jgi:hypothetical protein